MNITSIIFMNLDILLTNKEEKFLVLMIIPQDSVESKSMLWEIKLFTIETIMKLTEKEKKPPSFKVSKNTMVIMKPYKFMELLNLVPSLLDP